jgi:uncharacterized membrane-anchored protein YhcB (DUF1043 family)
MTTIPYVLDGELIDLVPKSELDKALANNAELLERLADRKQSHLHASARDVQMIQQQAIELSVVKAALSGRTVSCSQCNESVRTIEEMREAIKEAREALSAIFATTCSELFDTAAREYGRASLAKLQHFLK